MHASECPKGFPSSISRDFKAGLENTEIMNQQNVMATTVKVKAKIPRIEMTRNGFQVDNMQASKICKPKEKEPKKSWLYYELKRAFNDVKLMQEGKKKKKTAQEFLEEIRNGK